MPDSWRVLASRLLDSLILPPGGIVLLLLLVWLMWWRWPRLAHRGLAAAALLLAALSLPVTAGWLNRTLEAHVAVLPPDARFDAIVVLGGGKRPQAVEFGGDTVSADTLLRLRYAARLARQSDKPVLVTGGAPLGGPPEAVLMAAALAEWQVSARWVESASLTTADNARLSAGLLRQAGVQRIALVSQAWHLPRAIRAFERQGLTVLPAPTAFTRHEEQGWLAWLPRASALQESRRALREWLGLLLT